LNAAFLGIALPEIRAQKSALPQGSAQADTLLRRKAFFSRSTGRAIGASAKCNSQKMWRGHFVAF
jgi:hypothetical protein